MDSGSCFLPNPCRASYLEHYRVPQIIVDSSGPGSAGLFDAEAGGSQVKGQFGLDSESEASLSSLVWLRVKINIKKRVDSVRDCLVNMWGEVLGLTPN